jgi:hypothetical protein
MGVQKHYKKRLPKKRDEKLLPKKDKKEADGLRHTRE